jgi:DNA polymerase III subunit chi
MEILFYHLQNTKLEQTLPLLLEKSMARGWKCVVRASSPERLKALDDHLWTYADNSFLPHGLAAGNDTNSLPIILTEEDDRFGSADVMFSVDGAALPQSPGWQRVVLMFDGNDETARDNARTAWRSVKAQGLEATYWQQDDAGRWVKKA